MRISFSGCVFLGNFLLWQCTSCTHGVCIYTAVQNSSGPCLLAVLTVQRIKHVFSPRKGFIAISIPLLLWYFHSISWLKLSYLPFLWWLDQDPKIAPLVEQDQKTLERMFPEIPLWVKNPDFDRVWRCYAYIFELIFRCNRLLEWQITYLVYFSMKIDWLNKFLEYMWPYLDKVSMSLRVSANF